tara:strand:+ start:4818 stop:5678 length:861 start_codon:yes stop_codon:yes gene_type:complete
MSTQLDIRKNQGSMLSVPNPVTGTGNVMRGTFNNPYQMNAVNAVGSNNKGVNMLPLIGGIAAGAGLLTSLFNKPKNMNQNFSFDLSSPEYQSNEALLNSMGNLNQQGSLLRGMGENYQQTSADFLNPDSDFMTRQRRNLSQDIADNSFTQQNMLNAALAQRGAGGSLSSLLNAATSNRSSEQLRKGFSNIMDKGVGYSAQFANLGLGAMQGATSAYGAGGQLSSAMDARQLQNQQFNADQRNNYNQYLKTANYNQSVQNRNAASAWRNNLSNSLFNIAGSAFGMGG